MPHYGFLNCNESTTLVEGIDFWEGYAYIEAGSTRIISIPSQFFYKSKPDLKNSLTKIPNHEIKADIKSCIYWNTEMHFYKRLTTCSTVLIRKQ